MGQAYKVRFCCSWLGVCCSPALHFLERDISQPAKMRCSWTPILTAATILGALGGGANVHAVESSTTTQQQIPSGEDHLAPHHRKLFLAPLATAIKDKYIVVLSNRSSSALDKIRSILSKSGARLDYEYDGDFTGFVVSGLVSKFLDIILKDDDVEFVEQVGVMVGGATLPLTFLRRIKLLRKTH